MNISEEQKAGRQEGKLVNPSPLPSPTRGEGVISLSQRERVKSKNAFTLAEVFSSHFAGHRKIAFTLAEVLITLGIIGVVAAMTLPSLVQHYQEKQRINQLKVFASIFDQALRKTFLENGYEVSSLDILNNLKTTKICDRTNVGCANKTYHHLNSRYTESFGQTDYFSSSYIYALLANGGVIRMNPRYNCSDTIGTAYCGEIAVDINGDKAPNETGKDLFYFYVNPQRLLPFGFDGDTRTPFTACNTNNSNGYECTAWVLYNQNFDFLRCRDKLGWDKQKSCK